MAATLELTHRTLGVEVRRGPFDVMLDGAPVGSVELNQTFEMAVEPGPHTLQVRSGRKSSPVLGFEATDGEHVAFRCGGKRALPLFLASFIIPSLALSLHRV